MNHVLHVTVFKTGTGLRAKCSCGKRMGSTRGCDSSGLDYALYGARERFLTHCRELSGEPHVATYRIWKWMRGLGGYGPRPVLICDEEKP